MSETGIRHPDADPWFRVNHLLCSLLLLPPVALALFVALNAQRELSPANRGQEPAFIEADDLRFVLGAAVVASGSIALLTLARIALALACLCFPSRLRRLRRSWLVPLASLAAAGSTPVVCLLLPPEDPYTGAGFPGAAVLGAVVFGIIGAGFALPSIALFLYERSERAAQDGDQGGVVAERARALRACSPCGGVTEPTRIER